MLNHNIPLLVVIIALAPCVAFADESAQVAALKRQVAELDRRVSELEKKASRGEVTPDEARAARRAMFTQRMAQDQKKYTSEQLREAEQLYQVANKDWRSAEAKASLQTMIEKYPDVNRTGCAVLYLGQMSEGADREKYLTQAAEKHADSMYGDGVVVGAFARYYLGQHYAKAGG